MIGEIADRVLRRCEESAGGCWVFQGAKNKRGYGVVGGPNKTTALTHRVVYEFLVGPVPDGLLTDHLCRNRACCNPWHLDPVTPLVNSRRGVEAGGFQREVCINGHPYTQDNTGSRNGRQSCLTCRATRRARRLASQENVA